MKKRRIILSLLLVLLLILLTGCGKKTETVPQDGTYQINVTLSGGSGRASVASPTRLTVENGQMTAAL